MVKMTGGWWLPKTTKNNRLWSLFWSVFSGFWLVPKTTKNWPKKWPQTGVFNTFCFWQKCIFGHFFKVAKNGHFLVIFGQNSLLQWFAGLENAKSAQKGAFWPAFDASKAFYSDLRSESAVLVSPRLALGLSEKCITSIKKDKKKPFTVWLKPNCKCFLFVFFDASNAFFGVEWLGSTGRHRVAGRALRCGDQKSSAEKLFSTD